ncbi:hypothetical protein AVEN_19171-1 [Araneus ventricosus]|uniref:Uncharacterized protein n=1 Tax=Araneus ventricosus TaxID=182803 RepID=A0A4Y2RA79_ARAVE|nr:hypothetical protein AVEN_19171-1 [Araneus ventricosus]
MWSGMKMYCGRGQCVEWNLWTWEMCSVVWSGMKTYCGRGQCVEWNEDVLWTWEMCGVKFVDVGNMWCGMKMCCHGECVYLKKHKDCLEDDLRNSESWLDYEDDSRADLHLSNFPQHARERTSIPRRQRI